MTVAMKVVYIVAIVVITILLLSLILPLDTPKIETWDESIDKARKRLKELKEEAEK